MRLTPSTLSQTFTFSDPLPLERDVLYGRPQSMLYGPQKEVSLQEWLHEWHLF